MSGLDESNAKDSLCAAHLQCLFRFLRTDLSILIFGALSSMGQTLYDNVFSQIGLVKNFSMNLGYLKRFFDLPVETP